jgi:hypothetical protein
MVVSNVSVLSPVVHLCDEVAAPAPAIGEAIQATGETLKVILKLITHILFQFNLLSIIIATNYRE